PGEPGDATGNAAQSRFSLPSGLAVDVAGNVFVAGGNSTFGSTAIRKFSSDGQALAWGTAPSVNVLFPVDIATDAAGNLLVASNGFTGASLDFTTTIRSILKVSPAGDISVVAGADNDVRTVDGPVAQARFTGPTALAAGADGRIVVTEGLTGAVRSIDAQGVVRTLAGGNGAGFEEGSAATARFNNPRGLAAVADGTLFVVDRQNRSIRKISPAGVVSSLTPSGTASAFAGGRPENIAVAPNGTAYVSGSAINTFLFGRRVSAVSPDGRVAEVLPTTFDAAPVAVDGAGNLYLTEGSTIAMVAPEGAKRALATVSGGITGLAAGAGGKIYFSSGNGTAGAVDASGNVQTLAGIAGETGTRDGAGAQALFQRPGAVAVDAAGNLYVCDLLLVRKITPQGVVSTVADLAVLGASERTGVVTTLGGVAWTGGALYATLLNAVVRIAPLN
ncbi:MAG: hypothetical protein ABIU07_11720, partial [Ramlibacter sp.]